MSKLAWPDLFESIRPHLDLKGNGQPDHDGWVDARCIDSQNHRNGDRHHSLRINAVSGGVKCMSQGCISGNLNELAERLGVNRQAPESALDPLRRLAEERKLSPSSLRDKYGIRTVKGGWAFPVDDPDAHDHPHLKRDPQRWDDDGAPKNWWPRANVKASDLVYGLTHVERNTPAVYAAAGEIDCTTLQDAGFPAVTFLAGEWSTPTTKAIRKLIDHGILAICFVYDVDNAGRKGAPRVSEACVREGLQVHIVSLPGDLGEGGDINDLWARCGGDHEAFKAALEACPMTKVEVSDVTKVDGSVSQGSGSPSTFVRTFSEFLETAEAQPTEYLVEGLFPAG